MKVCTIQDFNKIGHLLRTYKENIPVEERYNILYNLWTSGRESVILSKTQVNHHLYAKQILKTWLAKFLLLSMTYFFILLQSDISCFV